MPRLPALWPVACEAYNTELVCSLILNAGPQTPRHVSSSEVDSHANANYVLDYHLSSAALEEIELFVGMGAKGYKAVPFHSIV
jgi:hypothetical protein